ncbi:hypothetical protein [Bradyrhizobium diazoefficiens]|nr:hypothetical protein [Bradyrhizobium diazoefficiens]
MVVGTEAGMVVVMLVGMAVAITAAAISVVTVSGTRMVAAGIMVGCGS